MALWWLRMAVIIWLLPLVRNPPVHFYIVSRAEKKSEAAVGDCVSIERRARDQGVIIKILPRRAWLCRSDRFKSRIFASNFDQLLFVLAAVPRVSEMLLGRALVAAHAHRVRALIVLNKTDLEAAARVARARLDLYRSLGYTALEISAKTQPEAA